MRRRVSIRAADGYGYGVSNAHANRVADGYARAANRAGYAHARSANRDAYAHARSPYRDAHARPANGDARSAYAYAHAGGKRQLGLYRIG